VVDIGYMFTVAESFNQDISGWNVSNVTSMYRVFFGATSFNQPIGDWDVSNVVSMDGMFKNASSFNQPIGNWNISQVTDIRGMFSYATSFNQPIGDWDVSDVTNMSDVFFGATSFNQPIGDWDVSSVTKMVNMFRDTSLFNQNIENWDVSNVTNMEAMFSGWWSGSSAFNQPLNDWNVSSVVDMNNMFRVAIAFNQDIGSWDVSSVSNMSNMFNESGLSTDNYDGILNNWSQQNVQSDVFLGADGINYCNGANARQILIDTYEWFISDAGSDCSTAGVDDQNQLDILIYPNPTSDIVYIDGNYTQLKVIIYNVLGKEILNKSITNSIDISHLDNGVYILQLSDGVKLSTRKIIKN